MIKSKLIEFKTRHLLYKGESYMRGTLVFKIALFRVIKWRKTVIYDVTMFEDYASHIRHWQTIKDEGANIPINAIKSRVIF